MKIVINSDEEESYKARGYKCTHESPAILLGEQAWYQIPTEFRSNLIVVECHDAKHARNNALPRKHVFRPTMERMVVGAEIVPYDVQQIRHMEGVTVAARADRDSMPEEMDTDRLYDTSREAAQSGKETLLEAIRQHESAIYVLKRCLVTLEIQ